MGAVANVRVSKVVWLGGAAFYFQKNVLCYVVVLYDMTEPDDCFEEEVRMSVCGQLGYGNLMGEVAVENSFDC